ncbi:MAG: DUF499 domain-containing protein [Verrucomicrobia bacterium]|nr:DUF499 domain-containing protein [Verrucomicrobiota bacterium]
MNNPAIKPWVEAVELHPDVLSPDFSEDIFALDLGPLADGNKNVPAVYRDPEQFFRASYLTNGLKSLLQDVLSRLSGGAGNRVLKLITPFGGGKSHTLASLYHPAGKRSTLDVIPEGKPLPKPGKVNIAVFDGQQFSAVNGKEFQTFKGKANALWGWVFGSLGGEKGYNLIRAADEARVAPGGDDILKLVGDEANLILLDEVLEYLISAGGIKVHDTTLRDETLSFIKRLTVAVGNTPQSVLVFSLQSSKRESLDYINLLQTLDHLAARKDQRREPVEGNEVLRVIQRRLLGKMPTEADSTPAATAHQEVVTAMRRAYAKTPAEQQQAEQEGIELRDRIRAAYPFHPALIDLMRERWAAIPDFQRTRGALRFLAACLRAAHAAGKSRAVLGPCDVPLQDQQVRLAFFKEVGQQSDFQACLEHDFVGANARARRIDERRAKEFPAEALKRPAMRIATAILMYSFGGLCREGATVTDLLPPGVSEPELLATCVGLDLDSTTVLACLKELKEQCLYLHFDGVRYCFKKDPNVTLLVEQEADVVARDEDLVRDKIKEMLEARLAGHNVHIWPTKSGEVPDREPAFIVAYLPLEFRAEPKAEQQRIAKDILEKLGDKPRQFRNGLGLAVPAADQIEVLRRAVRYLLAIERVKSKARQHNLTDEQKGQLRERESTEKAAAESAFLKLYTEVWLPKVDGSVIGIEAVAVGGRPLQTTLSETQEALVHERVMELVMQVQKRVFDAVTPGKVVEFFKLGDGTPPKLGITSGEIATGFYSFLGFTRLTSEKVVARAIATGVEKRLFGYIGGGAPALGADGKYQVTPAKARFDTQLAEDEIDLESGFIMLPQAIPLPPSPAICSKCGKSPCECAVPPVQCPKCGKAPCVCVVPRVKCPKCGKSPCACPPLPTNTKVELTFSADRDQLYSAWNAVANLADMAGKVSVTIKAESEAGFDKSKLNNGVLEPLREADLIQ